MAPFFTLLIHEGTPPALREVMPGRSVNVHCSRGDRGGLWAHDFWESAISYTMRENPFDMVCTVGFDFDALTDHQKRVVRHLIKKDAAVIRMDPA
jgi:hypothetical protein